MAAPHLVLVGLMGTGKSTVGAACAQALGRPFVDTDDLVAVAAGASVEEIFATQGEAAFRAYERAAVAEACERAEPTVIACGGGVVLDPANRDRLRRAGHVVLLTASPEALAARVGRGRGRPLLAGDAEGTLERLGRERAEAYAAAAEVTVDTTGRSIAEVTGAVLDEWARVSAGFQTWVNVGLRTRPYDVLVGDGVLRDVGQLATTYARAAVVTQPALADRYGEAVRDALSAEGVDAEIFLMGDGEDAKTLSTIEDLTRRFAAWGLLRADVVIGVGGGVVGDTAGFAAASYHRGVDVIHVPTTLLAMVDSAVGGKTGVNLPEGKNLVGAFHQPRVVVADTATLASLPDREYRAGLGEVIKYAALGDHELEVLLVDQRDAVLARRPDVVARVVARCVAAKAAVVVADEHERTGVRATLNLGHTLAHAIETGTHHALAHGEAVAVGLAFATQLAAELGRISAARARQQQDLLTAYGLPVTAPAGLTAADAFALMRRDKKAAGGLTFVLDGPRGVERVDDPDAGALERALAHVGVE